MYNIKLPQLPNVTSTLFENISSSPQAVYIEHIKMQNSHCIEG